jgi:hypothetical protein
MTPRERALILRMAAIAETGEWGGPNLRRCLKDMGWNDAQIDQAVTAVRGALTQVYAQAQMELAMEGR